MKMLKWFFVAGGALVALLIAVVIAWEWLMNELFPEGDCDCGDESHHLHDGW